MRRNVPLFGFLFGALMPWIGIYLFYLIKMGDIPFGGFVKGLLRDGDLAAKVFSLSFLLNLIPFYVFLNRKWYHATRGVLIATFLYALLIIWLKFIQ